jgi:hypothetical protein
MLGQHPQLAGLPELKLFSNATIRELEEPPPSFWLARGVQHRSPGLVRAIAQYKFHSQSLDSLAEAKGWLQARSEWSGAHILDSILEEVAPRQAVEKSPENSLTDSALRRLARAYPKARYLHLTRHPVTTQRSAQEHWKRIFPGSPQPGEPMAGVSSWVDTHSRILRFSGSVDGGRYLRVRAEDVLNDLPSQLVRVAHWLGIREDPDSIGAMMRPEESPFARFGPDGSGVIGGNDPGFLRNPSPRKVALPEMVEQPAGWVENAFLWKSALDLALRLGYE